MADGRVESEGFYEMLWDCDHCSAKGLLGKSQRHCPECGAPQNPDKRYYPQPGQQVRVDGHKYVGADRFCPACKSPMGALAKNCTQCGSPLDGGAEVRGVADPIAGGAAGVAKAAKAVTPKRKRWPKILAILLVLAALIGGAIWWFFIRSHAATLTVAHHHWSRTVAIEEFGRHSQSNWHELVPVGAYNPMCVPKQRSTRQVPDGEDCHTERHDKKDGTFEQVKKCTPKTRGEPVMDSWCSYTVDSWAKVGQELASGDDLAPQWPKPDPSIAASAPMAALPGAMGARREGAREETLELRFTDKGGDGAGDCTVDDATWRKYTDGQKLKVEVRARSSEIVCSSL